MKSCPNVDCDYSELHSEDDFLSECPDCGTPLEEVVYENDENGLEEEEEEEDDDDMDDFNDPVVD